MVEYVGAFNADRRQIGDDKKAPVIDIVGRNGISRGTSMLSFEQLAQLATRSGASIFSSVVTPVLIVAFALSLWAPVQRFWRPVIVIFGVIGSGAICLALRRCAGADGGNASVISMGLVAVLAFTGTVPLRFVESVIVSAVPACFGVFIVQLFGVHVADLRLNTEVVIGVYVMTAIAAWWRERNARRWFAETAGGSTTGSR
ncbi:MAG: hypothetical protein ABIQ30_13440 [Devosia sp.]